MNNICRLCLSYSPQNITLRLENSEILRKMKSCFLLEISFNEYFPNKICEMCEKVLEQFIGFYTKVSNNQKILENHLSAGKVVLDQFFISLRNDRDDKNEVKKVFLVDNKENSNICMENNKTIFPNLRCTVIPKNEPEIKNEIENNLSEIEFSSDDDITLSSIKEAKVTENNTDEINKIWKKNILNSRSRKQAKKKAQTAKTEIKPNKTDISKKNNFTEHKCLTCLVIFKSQAELLTHYNTEHKKNQNGSPKDTEIYSDYEIVNKENGQEIFKCKKCEKEYDSKSRITRHMISHLDSRPFICKLCGRTYKTVSEIIRHGRAHNGVKISCSFMCGYSTVYMGALKEHEQRHTTDFKYKCDKCEKGFQVKTWYLEHQNVHNGVKPFVCDICGHAFHMNRYLTAHKSSVHPQSSNLKRYVCVHCSLPCDSRKALTVHYKEHGIKSSYLCDLCGKTLSNSEQLKCHRRMHLGVKPYSCGICTKSFTKKFNLKLHERTHTSAKDYECVRCGKRYTQKSTLRRHLLRNHVDDMTNVILMKRKVSFEHSSKHGSKLNMK